MGKKSKIKPTNPHAESGLTNPTPIDDTIRVSFNFKHLQKKNKKFDYNNKNKKYFLALLERLKNISEMSKDEMTVQNRRVLQCHPINFTEESVSENGFGKLGKDIPDDAWQFGISKNEHGRVHGYFVDNTFYVVWLDPEHQLYPRDKK